MSLTLVFDTSFISCHSHLMDAGHVMNRTLLTMLSGELQPSMCSSDGTAISNGSLQSYAMMK